MPAPIDTRVARALAELDRVNTPEVLRARQILAEPLTVAKRDTSSRDRYFTPAHARLLYALGEAPATDTQLIRRYGIRTARPDSPWPFLSDAGIRSRRAELHRWGFVVWTGEMGRTRSNLPSRMWALTVQFPTSPVPPSPQLPAALAALSVEAGTDMLLGLLVVRVQESVR